MRDAKVRDVWRSLKKIDKYPFRISTISLRDINGFENPFCIDYHSAITSICGKNGAGKTTLLKAVYNLFKKDSKIQRLSDVKFFFSGSHDNKPCECNEESNNNFKNVYYLDPSQECSKIISYLRETQNVSELLEGVEENLKFNDDTYKRDIERVIGKKYEEIIIYEIEGAITADYTFPFFKLKTKDGVVYTNTDMGMGEFTLLFIFWYFEFYIEPKSLIFIEEPENFISARSQKYLVDHFAKKSFDRKIWITLSTHSEHILNNQSLEDIRVLKIDSGLTKLVTPNHKEKYLNVLGVMPTKQGAFLVEDFAAEVFLKTILNKISPELLADFEIIQLRCDSNILKLVQHFESNKEMSFELIAVLDADQTTEVQKILGRKIFITALPSNAPLSPELSLWPILENNLSDIAKDLNINQERLQEAYSIYETEEYHERFRKIAEYCNLSFETLFQKTIMFWLHSPENLIKVKIFASSILNRGNSVKFSSSEEQADHIFIVDSLLNDVPIRNSDIIFQDKSLLLLRREAKLGFNGINIILW